MKYILLPVALVLQITSFCQYYYNDITAARAIGETMKNYIGQKVKNITATGYDSRATKTTDYNEWQEIDAEKKLLKIITRNGQQSTRQYYQFDEQLKLAGITDSSGDIKSKTVYNYDKNNNIVFIETNTKDSLQDFTESIVHQYQYNAQGKLVKLWRIINGKDSIEYRFTLDEKGNVADEQLYRRHVGIDPVY
ncbi:MAG: DUF1398 family protein, partial [Flavisolibacter sp.]